MFWHQWWATTCYVYRCTHQQRFNPSSNLLVFFPFPQLPGFCCQAVTAPAKKIARKITCSIGAWRQDRICLNLKLIQYPGLSGVCLLLLQCFPLLSLLCSLFFSSLLFFLSLLFLLHALVLVTFSLLLCFLLRVLLDLRLSTLRLRFLSSLWSFVFLGLLILLFCRLFRVAFILILLTFIRTAVLARFLESIWLSNFNGANWSLLAAMLMGGCLDKVWNYYE